MASPRGPGTKLPAATALEPVDFGAYAGALASLGAMDDQGLETLVSRLTSSAKVNNPDYRSYELAVAETRYALEGAAVEQFAPYDRVQDENPEAREALRKLLQRMREEKKAAYIYVNNRLEGNSPTTIQAVVA